VSPATPTARCNANLKRRGSVNRFVIHGQKHHPRCLGRHHALARKTPPPSWSDSDDFVASFDIRCSCGNAELEVVGIPDDELGLYSPITTRCPSCRNEELLFDVTKHGHDVEIGAGSSYAARDGETHALGCKSCGNTTHSVLPWFTYQFESDDLADVPSTEVANYFDVFGIDLVCRKCGTVNHVGSYECA